MTLVLTIAMGLALTYVVLLGALLMTRPRGNLLGEALRLLPDLLRLLRRLAGDAGVPRAARVRLWLLLGYLAIPIDLVPDFVPVLGYADDAIIVSLVLRSVVRHAGAPVVRRHWPGTDDGLAALGRLTGLQLSQPRGTGRIALPRRHDALRPASARGTARHESLRYADARGDVRPPSSWTITSTAAKSRTRRTRAAPSRHIRPRAKQPRG